MLPLYAFMALIIGGEGILRYITSSQTQWGGSAAIQAFIFMSWVGCAYHVRHGTHLRLEAVRHRLPQGIKIATTIVDDFIWLVLAGIVIFYSIDLLRLQFLLESSLEGTDSFPQWIATATVPLSWTLIGFRAMQHLALQLRGMASTGGRSGA